MAAAAALLLVGIATARAAEPVGSVAALEGRAEVLHAGEAAWTALAVGDGVVVGDQVRTLADSKLKLLFRDDSVLSLAANSQLAVTEQMVAGEAPVSRFSLLLGTVRAIVTERYGQPGANFEVETPTAVAGVRGTGFIAKYDGAAAETTVVGLFDVTRVRAVTDTALKREVRLGPGETTRVRRGGYPLRPQRMPQDVLRSLTGATEVRGGGKSGAPGSGARTGGENPLPKGPAKSATLPADQVVDQPIDVLKQQKRRGVQPPPPPVPRR